MADRLSLRAIEGRREGGDASTTREIPTSVLIAEERDRPLSPLQQAVEQTARMITASQAQIREYDHYYRGSERPGAQELQTEFEQMIKQAQSHKRLFDLSKTNSKAFSQAFSEYYGRCAKELQGILERYPEKFEGFLEEQKKVAQRADEITRCLIFEPAVFHLWSPEKEDGYTQAGSFIPAVDISLRRRTVVQVDAQVLASLSEMHRSVRGYDGTFSCKDCRDIEVSLKVAYACVFYQACEYAFQEHVESCEEQGRRCPGHMVERTQQELRERRSLLEQQLGFPDIPALLGHKGMLSEERHAALRGEYETIQQQGYAGDGFDRLERASRDAADRTERV